MPSKNKPLSEQELAAYEASRDFAADLIQSIKEMKGGLGTVVYSPIAEARKLSGLSAAEFASALDVPVSTLHEWETSTQAQPGEAALKSISMALKDPEAFRLLVRTGQHLRH